MARVKEFSDGPQVRELRKDGITEAQMANMQAIYEDPTAYAEWRKRMGLDVAREDRTASSVMRERVESKLSGLGQSLEFPREKRRKEYRPIEETLAEYAAKPLKVSPALLETLKPKDPTDV